MSTQSITKPAAEPPGRSSRDRASRTFHTAGALRRAHRLLARFRGADAQERWGYGVWLFAGLVFGVPESWAGIMAPPWPALSDTIGHLEQLWPPSGSLSSP